MKYVLGFISIIILIILLMVMLIGGGNKSKTPVVVNASLVNISNSNVVTKLTVDGPINSAERHIQEQIVVSKDSVTYNKIVGYTGTVVETRKYANNSSAYNAFIKSLNKAGYTTGDRDPAHKDNQGYCPMGNRYNYEIIDGSKTVQNLWSTSCAKPKTYEGNVPLTLNLFKAQVADYNNSSSDFYFSLSF